MLCTSLDQTWTNVKILVEDHKNGILEIHFRIENVMQIGWVWIFDVTEPQKNVYFAQRCFSALTAVI